MGFTQAGGTFQLSGGEKLEPLSSGISIISKKEYSFSTDTVLLASFSMPKDGEICADFGSGCGAIPFIWLARSKPAFVYAVEIQKDACSIIKRSAEINGFTDRMGIINQDINDFKKSGAIPHNLDLITCNPPYTENNSGVQSSNKGRMAARHELLCTFNQIAVAAASFLRWGGRFCCCMRPERLCSALLTLKENGMEPKLIRFVQHSKEKPPFLFLLQANRGGNPGMKAEPTLFVKSESGGYSEEMKKIYGTYMEGSNER